MEVKEIVEFVVKEICMFPDKVKVTETKDSDVITYSIDVSKEDMPRVVGRGGVTLQAIRSIVRAIGGRRQKQFAIILNEPF